MIDTAGEAERAGVRHLREIACEPRAAGSVAEAKARAYAAVVLREAGFTVHEESFEYSRLPGSYGTPLIGFLLGATVVAGAMLALDERAHTAAIVLMLGLAVAFLSARALLGEGVLRNPWMRATGINLVATRGSTEPRVWLVAHLDSKSQPVPSAVRIAGVVTLSLAIVASVAAALLTLIDGPSRTGWWVASVLAVVGAIPLVLSVVGNDSPGAVDNASGVAAVLEAATRARPTLDFGVLLPSAEELGLAGARAFVATRPPGIALNCDGVDDGGDIVIMHTGKSQTELVNAIERESRQPVSVRKMPPGLLTDSVAFADEGWKTVTVSHGSAKTLRRVHTKRDSLVDFAGSAIVTIGELLVLVLEALV